MFPHLQIKLIFLENKFCSQNEVWSRIVIEAFELINSRKLDNSLLKKY